MTDTDPNTTVCEQCGAGVEYTGDLAKCECGWYDWWPDGEPPADNHPGW